LLSLVVILRVPVVSSQQTLQTIHRASLASLTHQFGTAEPEPLGVKNRAIKPTERPVGLGAEVPLIQCRAGGTA
jgi:hypothetical protein